MPNEATEAPEETQDTPQQTDTPEAPESQDTPEATDAASEPSTDYEKRYNDLVPEYTKSQQLLSALQGRHGEEAQREAARQFGFEFEDGDEESEDDGEYVDPTERKLSEIEQKLADREAAEQAAELDAREAKWLKENVDKLLEKESATLTDNERTLLISHAKANRFEDGQPDIEGAFKLLSGAEEAARQRYLDSKKAPKVPVGSAGEKSYDFNDDEQRLEALAAEMARARAAEES